MYYIADPSSTAPLTPRQTDRERNQCRRDSSHDYVRHLKAIVERLPSPRRAHEFAERDIEPSRGHDASDHRRGQCLAYDTADSSGDVGEGTANAEELRRHRSKHRRVACDVPQPGPDAPTASQHTDEDQRCRVGGKSEARARCNLQGDANERRYSWPDVVIESPGDLASYAESDGR